MARPQRVALGRVGRPHGVLGEVRLDFPGGLSRGLRGYETLYLEQDGEFRRVELESERPHGRFLLAKFSGIETPDQARALTHATLWVERGEMPVLAEDEYYHADLLGCRVEDEAGALLGTVADVFANGDHDLLVIREGGREWMLPVLARWVLEIDLEGERVLVRPPEGIRG